MNKTALMLHSSDVMKLLEASPAVMLGLQSLAAEKVAEEIKRKIGEKLAKGEVDRLVSRAVNSAETALRARWSFPKEAEIIVKDLVRETIQAHVEAAKNAIFAQTKARCDEMVKMAVAEADTKITNARVALNGWVQTEVKKMARDEFISVMREAKEALS